MIQCEHCKKQEVVTNVGLATIKVFRVILEDTNSATGRGSGNGYCPCFHVGEVHLCVNNFQLKESCVDGYVKRLRDKMITDAQGVEKS